MWIPALVVLACSGAVVAQVSMAATARNHHKKRHHKRLAFRSGPCGVAGRPPHTYRHVLWIVFENQYLDHVIGNRSLPYTNKLAGQCGLATGFFAEAHPSLPNYIAMTSGGTQGV